MMSGPKEKSKKKRADEDKPTIVKNVADLQRLKLEKLMKNPDKPIVIPERPKDKNTPHVPEFVRNVMGSSAGAGSGEFHVYRHLRRKEYARQKFIQERAEKETQEEAYHRRIEENKRKAEEETAKKRAKRLKKKKNMKVKKPKNEQIQSESESDADDDNEEVPSGHVESNDKSTNSSQLSTNVEQIENSQSSISKNNTPSKDERS